MKKRIRKVKEILGLRQAYDSYKKDNKDSKKLVNKKIFMSICKDFNKTLRDVILNDSTEVVLPHRLGTLRIRKKKRKDIHVLNKTIIDFKKSKELGYKVYYIDDYIYRWLWDKRTCVVKWKTIYYFKACRTASREIAKQIKSGNDYFG